MRHDRTTTTERLLEMLTAFQLTRQEAAIYVALLSEGEMNGYSTAKFLGISRSNAYTGLAGLVDKGAAWMVEGRVTLYTPVPPEEFLDNRMRRLSSFKKRVIASIPEQRPEPGGYITIRGEEQILDRLHHLLEGTDERVYVALHGRLLAHFHNELAGVLSQGKKVVIITNIDAAGELDAAGMLSDARMYIGDVDEDQVRVIVDSSYVLTGELTGGSGASCLFSNQKHLVDIFKTALKNEMRLIEMGEIPKDGRT